MGMLVNLQAVRRHIAERDSLREIRHRVHQASTGLITKGEALQLIDEAARRGLEGRS